MDSLSATLAQLGVEAQDLEKITEKLQRGLKEGSNEACWQNLVRDILVKKPYPFALHLLLYKTVFPQWENLPSPAWLPTPERIKESHIGKFIGKGFKDYPSLHHWSVTSFQDFWQTMISILDIQFDRPYEQIVDLSTGVEAPKWLPGARMNIMRSCFQARPDDIAIISQNEQGELIKTSYQALDRLTNRIANSLAPYLHKGERAAIMMPMTREAVAIYIGVIKAGCVVVAIPDSFASEEIAVRLRIAKTKLVFCQDHIVRDGKVLPLYERLVDAKAPRTIVLPARQKITLPMREEDLQWTQFLDANEAYTPVSCQPQEVMNILFSSGTTGEPKGIPWHHCTAIKCGSDAYLHHDVAAGDRFCWPTNLGWMMGPWLIFACLLNRATIALYDGTPNGRAFGEFIQDARVTHLGVVPTMVKTWRSTACMEGLDWRGIKLFTSTGERSNIEDMLYLMFLAEYRPIIEYCGGTEIAGAYITGTVVEPCAPAAFTTAALGLDFVILDENGHLSDNGEVALVPPSIGLSTELLNKDHYDAYFAQMPQHEGHVLRRHGDQVKRYENGFYRLLGRTDDTMKLGGIKVSSAEIETVLNELPFVYETAAIAINPPDGGPSQLVIYLVPQSKDNLATDQIKTEMQKVIKEHLNPLFKIHAVRLIDALPRTASNKVMRRVLRDQYLSNI